MHKSTTSRRDQAAVDTNPRPFSGKQPDLEASSPNRETLDLWRLNGIEYLADWVIDDLEDIARLTKIQRSLFGRDQRYRYPALQHLPSEQ